MTQLGPSADLAVHDISVDREGRVSITNPWIAERLQAAAGVKRPVREAAPNTNCGGCNVVEGCSPSNSSCPTNTVKNCGGTKPP